MKLFLIILALSSAGCSKVGFSAIKTEAVKSTFVPVDTNATSGAFEISSAGKLSQSQQVIIQSSLGSFSPATASHNNSAVNVKTGFSETLGELF